MVARRTLDLLPQIFQTKTNRRFLNATVDQLIQEPVMTRMSSYVGRGETSPTYRAGDPYIQEGDEFSQFYQLEPSLVVRKRMEQIPDEFKVDNVYSYLDLMNEISAKGAINNDHNRLFSQEHYNYQGFIDLEKLINYGQYYWVPNGPDAIDVFAGDLAVQKVFTIQTKGFRNSIDGYEEQLIGDYGHTISGFGAEVNPTITLVRGGNYVFDVSQPGFPFYIQTTPGDFNDSVESVDYQQNISKREIKGVTNNGADSGQIFFAVPKKDAQDALVTLPVHDTVDMVLDNIPFNKIWNTPRKTFYEDPNYEYTLDGIRSGTLLKKVVFTDTSDDNWIVNGSAIPPERRKGIWILTVDNNDVYQLSYADDWPTNTKMFVREGRTYGYRYVYKDSTATIRLVPPITAPLDTLYYQSPLYGAGTIKIIDAIIDSVLDVNDILGKKNYISPNGIKFTNGLKIRFSGQVKPAEYANNEYVVEGVGSAISLQKWNDLVTPESYTITIGSGYDAPGEEFDTTSFESTGNAPTNKEYVTISRASKDGNPWSRGNRWFHKDTLAYTASILTPGIGYPYIENNRAKRPIVEFVPNLYLYDGAESYAGYVDLIDTTSTDALSTIEGSTDYFVDGVQLNTGLTVIFTNDEDPNVRNKIYQVNKANIDGLGTFQIHLEPIRTMSAGESLAVISGVSGQGLWYVWNADGLYGGASNNAGVWKLGQQKTRVGQEPLFDVLRRDPAVTDPVATSTQIYTSWGDSTAYPSSTFRGSKLFSYKIAATGAIDSELGFALSYRNIGNLGDILFENNFDTDTFTYNLNNADQVKQINAGNPRTLKDSDGNFTLRNPWTKIEDPSKQYIQQTFIATLNRRNDFRIDGIFESSRYEKNVFVMVNAQKVSDFQLLVDSANKQTILRFPQDLVVNDKLVVQMYGEPSSQRPFYTVPRNLERNSFNDTFDRITLGQLRDHLIEITKNSLEFKGEPAGNNNLRDINYIGVPGKILQHSAPMHIAQLLMNNPSTDIVQAIDHSRREYNRFKERFFNLMETKQFKDLKDIPSILDSILKDISEGADPSLPFYYTDMVVFGRDYELTAYQIFDPNDRTFNAIYPYGFDKEFGSSLTPYRNILVYHYRPSTNVRTQLLISSAIVYEGDCSVNGRIVTISENFDLQPDDVIELREYTSSKGCMVPATPSSLGLYQKFKPGIYLDDTYLEPINVIQGHDGSIMPAFNDFRDEVILEFERRVYNNTRIDWYLTDVYHQTVEPSAFRQTGYSVDEWTQLLAPRFLEWAGTNGVDVFENTITTNDPFSWNYSQAVDRLFGENVPGHWRGIYKYFYDTDRPHQAPWEIAGFYEKPSYWDAKYGAAPYTSGNTVMWEELEQGIYYEDQNGDGIYETQLTDPLFAKPGLTQIIPVDEHGELMPPRATVLKEYNELAASSKWRFGDQGPAETAWRRSSDYPFSVMIAYALAKPAEFCSYAFNLRDYKRYGDIDQFLNNKTNNRKLTSEITDNDNLIPGINMYLRDRLVSLGQDVTENLVNVLDDVQLNLAYKMAGFSDKKYLQILAEQSSPSSLNSGVLIPEENYDLVLTRSAPVSKVTYSAVVIEKADQGYIVTGFDQSKPYFNIIPSLINNDNYAIRIGNSTVTVYNQSDNRVLVVPYGTLLTSKQQVADFLVSYGRYLTALGFQFDELLADNTTTKDWTLAIKEFLFWSQQNWDSQTVISLTPPESTIKFDNLVAVVNDLSNTFNGTRIIDSDNKVVPLDGYRVYRDGTAFEISLRNRAKGIHLIDIETVQYEHTLVFDNITVFNDVIFQQEIGNRQQRLKIVGKKTAEWNGSLYAPGFLINHEPVAPWSPMKDYYKGEIVTAKNKYFTAKKFLPGKDRFDQNDWYEIENTILSNQLIPNPAFNASQFEGFYDVDSEDVNVSADIQSRHATGFQKRKYFTDIGLDNISQHKFYLGMIAEKGTQAAINKFLRAKLPYIENNLTIDEEWAIKNGEYGNTENRNLLEIPLGNALTNNNITVLELLDKNDARSGQWNTFKTQDLAYLPSSYRKDIFAKTNAVNKTIKDSGPVLLNEVSATVFDVNKIEKISGLSTLLGEGSRVWVAKDIDDDWNVYRVSSDQAIYITNVSQPTANEIEFKTARPHSLALRDKVMIKNAQVRQQSPTGTSNSVNLSGFYRITAVGNKKFRVAAMDGMNILGSNVRGLVFKLKPVRYESRSDFAQDTPYRGWKPGDKIWATDVNGNWQVLRNQNPWSYEDRLSPLTVGPNDDFGKDIVIGHDQRTMVVSSIDDGGKIYIYGKDDFENWNGIETLQPGDSYFGEFGTSLSISENNTLVVGAPTTASSGAVYLLSLSDGLSDFKQVIYDPTYSSGDRFGHSVSISNNNQWIYVSAKNAESVDAYQLVTVDPYSKTHTADGSTSTFTMPPEIQPYGLIAEEVKVFVDGVIQIPYVDYDVNITQDSIVFNVDPAADAEILIDYSDYYFYVNSIANPGSSNEFGDKVFASTDGSQVLISAPAQTVTVDSIAYTEMGAVYVYQRTIENFISDGATVSYTTSYSPSLARVTIDGIETLDWSNVGSTFTLDAAAATSAIIGIETNDFVQLAELVSPDAQEKQRYGTDIILCPNNCSIYVGSPKYLSNTTDPGAVYRHVNIAKVYGAITGKISNPTVSISDSLLINGFLITLTGTDIDSVVDDINDSALPGVSATKTADGKLRITTDSQLIFNKLNFQNVTGTPLEDLGLELFSSVQRIDTIYQEDGASFGETLALSPSANKLVIGTTKASGINNMTLDGDTTVFDGSSTLFRDRMVRSGAAYLYEYQPSSNETDTDIGQFTYAAKIINGDVKAGDEFGRKIAISNNWMMIASPKGDENDLDKGVLYVYRNATADFAWKVERQQSTDIDSDKLTRAFIYNNNTKQVVAELPVLDAAQGKYWPEATKEISYFSDYDPAVYNQVPTTNTFNYDRRTAWGKEQVGKLWWDTNAVKYLDWNQGTLLEKANIRDLLFPSSSVDIYEWTESGLDPLQYNSIYGSFGRSSLYTVNPVFTQLTENDENGVSQTKYYFWTKANVLPDQNITNRLTELKNTLTNPRTLQTPFVSIVASNAVALYNCQNILGEDYILRLEYRNDTDALPIHNEWSIFNDGSRKGLSDTIFNKLVDSWAGEDTTGRNVPDTNLKEKQRYGLSIRPRQSVFADRRSARKFFVDYVNDMFSRYPIRLVRNLNELQERDPFPESQFYHESVETDIELGYLDTTIYVGRIVLVKNDSTNGGWTLRRRNVGAPWKRNNDYLKDSLVLYEDVTYLVSETFTSGNSFDDTYLIPLTADVRLANDEWTVISGQTYDNNLYWEYADWYAVGYSADTIPTNTIDFSYQISEIDIRNNDIIKIKNSTQGGFQLVRVANNTLELIGQEAATIRLKNSVYDTQAAGFGIDDRSFEAVGFDRDNAIEIRNLFTAVINLLIKNAGVFVDEFRAAYKQLINQTIELISTQFTEIDWLFKTSFVSIEHQIRKLDQIPVYVRQPETLVQDYINEVKPYHVKLRKYLSSYPGSDTAEMYSTDFDLPAYLTADNRYKSPDIYNPNDAVVFESYPYKSWADNYGYEVSGIDIIDGGSGYTNDTVLTFIAQPSKEDVVEGSGAKAKVKVTSGGKISQVILESGGNGYLTAPFILIEGEGTGAKLVARIKNDKVRTIKTEVIFDRINYKNTVDYWQPNTEYVENDLFIYDNIPYRVYFEIDEWQPRFAYTAGELIRYKNVVYQVIANFTSDIGFEYDNLIRITPSFTSGDDISLVNTIEYTSRRWEPRTRFRKDEIIWETLNDQTRRWEESTIYSINDLILYGDDIYIVIKAFLSGSVIPDDTYVLPYSHKNVFYQVKQDFTSGQVFDSFYLIPYFGDIIDNASDRIWSYYQATSGRPGKQLAQLMKGIEYPGVFVKGLTFDQEPGFDIGNYDIETFDALEISPEGIPVNTAVDTEYYSLFGDSLLGLAPDQIIEGIADLSGEGRAEDIITDGSKFIDTYSSHAPEELVPASVFDTLDIQVTTAPGDDYAGDGAGPDIRMLASYSYQDVRFSFNDEVYGGVEKVIVFTANEGFKIEGEDFVIDWNTKEVVFNNPFPTVDDIIYCVSLGATGENILDYFDYYGDGTETKFAIENIRSSLAQQVYVKIDGQEASGYTVTYDPDTVTVWSPNTLYNLGQLIEYNGTIYQAVEDFASLGTFTLDSLIEYDYYPVVIFNTPPAAGAYIQIHVFDVDAVRKAYSSIKEITYTVDVAGLNPGDPVAYPTDYIFTLPELMQYQQPWNSQISVRLNKEELSPANNTYYTGDGSTVDYMVPLIGNLLPSSISDNDIVVVLDGVSQAQNIDYTIYRDGSSDPVVVFNAPPAVGAKIIVSDNSVADYRVLNDSQVLIKSVTGISGGAATNLKVGDKVTIIAYSNHDMYDMRTQVFQGGTFSTTISGGFDTVGFDAASGFDASSFSVELNTVYDLSRTVNNPDYLQVFLNGKLTVPVYDWQLQSNGTRLKLSSELGIQATDLIHIRHFSENTRKPTIRFRYFKDMRDNEQLLGIGYTEQTVLTANLELTDTEIFVENASVLAQPSFEKNQPGVVFVNGERITYWLNYSLAPTWIPDTDFPINNLVQNAGTTYEVTGSVNGASFSDPAVQANVVAVTGTLNKLGRIRRGTAGTGAIDHPAGAAVVDGSLSMAVPGGPRSILYKAVGTGMTLETDGNSLQDTDTAAAKYLRAIGR